MTETIAPPTPITDAVTERLAKLERSVKRLRKKVRQLDREEVSCIVLTPEWEAELDRRVAEIDANPGQGRSANEVFSDLRAKLATCRG